MTDITAPGGAERSEPEESAVAETALEQARGPLDWFHRWVPAHVTTQVILINFIGLLVFVSGILYFNQSRQGLIDARVQSLMTQAQIMASAVASSATIDTDQILFDPERLLEQQAPEERAGSDPGDLRNLEFLINPERAGPVLRRLVAATDTRARLYDRDGLLVVDSRNLYGRGEILRIDLPPVAEPKDNLLVKWWKSLGDWLFQNDYPQQKEIGLDNGKEFPEVVAALNGASVSTVRVNSSREIIVSVAVPIQRFRAVLGALVLSTKGGEIDGVLRSERRIVFFTFLCALLVAALLSMLIAGQIAEPIRRLAGAAERVRRGVNKRVEIPDFTHRRDEIGHLSGALRDMTRSLYNRIDAIEAFAADVSHELKNPLTSLRSAVETLPYARTEEQRTRLMDIVKDDVKRLDRLISDISDASRLDAELARVDARPLDLRLLLSTLVGLANETKANGPRIELAIEPPPAGMSAEGAYHVLGHDNRMGQVVRNLLDNAVSFSPPGSRIKVTLRRSGQEVRFHVDDEGPGLNPDNVEKIFDRFYTDRPEGSFGKNSGLGLSISRQIVEAHRGRIRAENRYGKAGPDGVRPVSGARFVVRLPAMPDDWEPGRDG